jgi:hypothetical protein
LIIINQRTNTKKKLKIVKIINSVQNLIDTNFSYATIKTRLEVEIIRTKKIDFSNSKYSKNNKYSFPYSIESAKIIISFCSYFTDSFTLLKNTYFTGELNLHLSIYSLEECTQDTDLQSSYGWIDEELMANSQFSKSNLDQKSYFQTLEIATWSYSDLVVSAIFFYLDNLYNNYLEKQLEKELLYTKFSSNLKGFSSKTALFFLSKTYGKSLFSVLQKTNIFFLYPESWLYGFTSFLHEMKAPDSQPYANLNRLYFYKELKQYDSRDFNFFYIAIYLKVFENFIPSLVIKEVYKYSYRTKSGHLIYYILKKYLNIFDIKKSESEKQSHDTVLTMHLQKELGN